MQASGLMHTAWLLPGQACKLLQYVAGKNTFTLLFKRWQTQCLRRQFWRLSQVITFTAPLRFLDSMTGDADNLGIGTRQLRFVIRLDRHVV